MSDRMQFIVQLNKTTEVNQVWEDSLLATLISKQVCPHILGVDILSKDYMVLITFWTKYLHEEDQTDHVRNWISQITNIHVD